MKNNLFNFATGELSQDAMICWCINWFNDSYKPRLQQMAKEILVNISGIEDIKSVSIHRQYNKIDVLLIINDEIPVIIEDKIFTSEHDDQINRYVEEIRRLAEKDGCLGIEGKKYTINVEKIRTVYWKTGHHYDADKVVIADKIVNIDDALAFLKPYYNDSEILADYINKLYEDKEWYEKHKKYWEYENDDKTSHWNLNISRHQIAQYTLMREIFLEELWTIKKGRYHENYQVYSGSSSGRPWTEMRVFNGRFSEGDKYVVFWRIDTDSKAPYISLRLYEPGYDRKSKECIERHALLWEKLRCVTQSIVEKSKFEINNHKIEWENVNPGNKRNYNEAAIFNYHFKQETRDMWMSIGGEVKKMIKTVNDEFCIWANNELEKCAE